MTTAKHAPPRGLIIAVNTALNLREVTWQSLSGGRVNHLWKVGQIVIKHYMTAGQSPMFPNDPKAEAAVLAHLAPSGLSPTLLAQGEDWIAYTFVAGLPWQDGTEPVATAFTRLHTLDAPKLALRVGPNGSTQLLAQATAIAKQCSRVLPPPPPDPQVRPATPRLIHGDAVPGNIIQLNENVTFIDWQCPAIGDPVDDIATFLSPAMQWLYRGIPLTNAETKSFRAGLPQNIVARYDLLAPLYHWRMAAHCLWKTERGAPDYDHATVLELSALQTLSQKHS
jgi:thiamine kinase